MIIVILLSGAVALSASSLRGTTYDANYHEAEHIGEILAEKIVLAKSTGRVDFGKTVWSSLGEPLFSVMCFDSDNIKNVLSGSAASSNCYGTDGKLKSNLPFPTDISRFDSDAYVSVIASDTRVPFDNTAFADGFFSWKIDIQNGPGGVCPSISGVDIPSSKCRVALISVKWEQPTGMQTYSFVQYFADWEK
jgi:hypothetical protein